jgi:DNA-binding NarL/FixJ family response regulator
VNVRAMADTRVVNTSAAPATIGIVAVDDDEAFLDSVRNTVAGHAQFTLLGTARNLAEARRVLAAATPDVLLVDLGLPDGSGIALIRELHARCPDTDIMVVTVFGDEAHVLASIEAGATGYLLKRNLPDALMDTVLQLRAGGSPISPIIARQLLHRFQAAPAPGALDDCGLSEREREVLMFIAKGFTVGEIAGMLDLSAHTVATHVKRIYRKLAVHSRTEALFEAGRLGLL